MPRLERAPNPNSLTSRMLAQPVLFTMPLRATLLMIHLHAGHRGYILSASSTILITTLYSALLLSQIQSLRHRRLYWHLVPVSQFPAIVAIHLLALALAIFSFGDLGIGVSLDFYLWHYWNEHRNHITRVNTHLLTVGPYLG